jgi:hypothetical protein
MDKSAAIERIRKCLALSESANEHEAAAAMRQARKLMDKYDLSDVGAEFFALKDEEVTNGFSRPPNWYCNLLAVIGNAFGCSVFTGYKRAVFVGPAAAAEVASYSLEVVQRLLQKRKAEFLEIPSVKMTWPAKKRELGAAFAEGFVMGVDKVVREFASKITDEDRVKHTQYLEAKMERKVDEATERKSKLEKGGANLWAAQVGHKEGAEISLREGVSMGGQPLRLEAQ